MHCGPPNQNFGWAVAHPAAPHMFSTHTHTHTLLALSRHSITCGEATSLAHCTGLHYFLVNWSSKRIARVQLNGGFTLGFGPTDQCLQRLAVWQVWLSEVRQQIVPAALKAMLPKLVRVWLTSLCQALSSWVSVAEEAAVVSQVAGRVSSFLVNAVALHAKSVCMNEVCIEQTEDWVLLSSLSVYFF